MATLIGADRPTGLQIWLRSDGSIALEWSGHAEGPFLLMTAARMAGLRRALTQADTGPPDPDATIGP